MAMNEHAPISLITGAGSGIGRACAIALGGEGHRTVLVGRRRQMLEQTAERCAEETMLLPADVSDPAQVWRVIDDTLSAFGRIDSIVHCAGLAPLKPIEDLSIDDWNATIATNLSAAFYLAKAAWPALVAQRGGVIVNLSSLSARDPFPGFSAYGAAKAGINLLGLSLAREGQAHGIRVHTIAPGGVETPMLRGLFSCEQVPAEQVLDPDEVAAVVVQCIAGPLSPTSGEVIYVHRRL
jgi:NAD(P)-dependent dehydrogenase (short-subunit alcohol dehydrogenase family)